MTAQIPVAKGSWFLGQLADRKRLGADFYGEMARRHGDVCALQLGQWKFVLVSNPALVAEVLRVRPDRYSKGDGFATLRNVLGDGLFFSEGARWKRQRRMVQPTFHRANLGAAADGMTRCIRDALPVFDEAVRTGRPLDLHHEMTSLTLDIAAQTLFGATITAEVRDRIGASVEALSQGINERLFSVFQGLPLWVPLRMNRTIRGAVSALDEIVYGLIDARSGATSAQDLLGDLLAARDPETGEALSRNEIRDQVMTFFLAGHETSASAITWAWKLLLDHPDAAAQVRAEADKQATQFTTAVFQEAIRLYPPGWTFTRQAVTDDTLGGFAIPAGTNLMFCPYAMHRDPRFWPDPNAFRPERFPLASPEERAAYLPFGSGPRACIGGQFATMEATRVLTELARRYEFTEVPGAPITVSPLVTLRPHPGVAVYVTARGAR